MIATLLTSSYTSPDGEYAGFDEDEPTSETGGKARAINVLREKHNYSPVVMIGDGVTDLEAKGPADVVIGFGGNVVCAFSSFVLLLCMHLTAALVEVRERVVQEADWYVRSFHELLEARQQPAQQRVLEDE